MHYIFENKDVLVAKLKKKFITAVICDVIWFLIAIVILLITVSKCDIVPVMCMLFWLLIFVTLKLHERVLFSHTMYSAFQETPSVVHVDGAIFVTSRSIRLLVTPAYRDMTGVFCHIDLSNLVYRLEDE